MLRSQRHHSWQSRVTNPLLLHQSRWREIKKEGEGGGSRAEEQNQLHYKTPRAVTCAGGHPCCVAEWLFPGLAGEARRDGKGDGGEGRRKTAPVRASIGFRGILGMKAALGPLPASSIAVGTLRASRLAGWRLPWCAENGIKKNNNKKSKTYNNKKYSTSPPPPPPPVSTTQQQPRKAKSFTSPEDVTIETEIRPTPRILPPGKVIKCFLSIAVGKVTADKPSEEKWSGDAGTWELFK